MSFQPKTRIEEKIEHGEMYAYSEKISALASAATHDVRIITGAAIASITAALVTSESGPVDIYFYEGDTISANGTQGAFKNLNRNIASLPDTEVWDSPTVTATGTQVFYGLIPGTNQSASSNQTGVEEWVLKPSTEYLIRITNNSAQPADIQLEFAMYEG